MQVRQTASRSTLGVKVIDLEADDQVSDITIVPPEEQEIEDEAEAED